MFSLYCFSFVFLIISYPRFVNNEDAEKHFLNITSASEEEESQVNQDIEEKEDFLNTGIVKLQMTKRKYFKVKETNKEIFI